MMHVVLLSLASTIICAQPKQLDQKTEEAIATIATRIQLAGVNQSQPIN